MKDFGLLVGRAVVGLLVAGHGAQKLFGWFEGPGWQQWTQATETRMGMKPGYFWGSVQALGEFGGGVLMALGFLNPLGPIATIASMAGAWYKGHWGKPIWSSQGGGELSVSYLAAAVIVGTQSPGKYSLDSVLGVRVPRWVTVLALLGSAGLFAESISPKLTPQIFGAGDSRQTGQAGGQPADEG